MPTYTYESVETGERFDFTQKMDEPRYTSHPESGEEMVRVIVAGVSIRYNGIRSHVNVNKKLPAATACGCASNVALAKQMFQNTRETPAYGSVSSRRTVTGGVTASPKLSGGKSHSHSHGSSCNHKH
jgi:predicted nucleic acid-binding Zn ribbon protein